LLVVVLKKSTKLGAKNDVKYEELGTWCQMTKYQMIIFNYLTIPKMSKNSI